MIVPIAVVQMKCGTNPQRNLQQAAAAVRDAAARGARIVCLPELFMSEYFCRQENHDHFRLAEEVPGPTTHHMCALAAELKVVLIVPLFERRAPGIYHNTAVIIEADGSLAGRYRKMHVPDDPQFHEKFYFTPGDLGFCAWETSAGAVGVLICWDQWYPEAARLTALKGARVIFYPTAIGWLPHEKAEYGAAQHDAWQTVQRSHAIANGVFVAAANRVGMEAGEGGAIEFWGGSFICDPWGQILGSAGHSEETVVMAPCELGDVEKARTHWPFLRDRRTDAYGGLTQRYLD